MRKNYLKYLESIGGGVSVNLDQRNLAYDLSLFEENSSRSKRQNNVVKIPKKTQKVSTKKKLNFATTALTFFSTAIVVSIIAMMIVSQIQLAELTDDINDANKVLDEKNSLYTQLQMKLESDLSLTTVENYAKNNLGMKKISPNQVEYINLSHGDKAEVNDSADKKGILNIFKDLF